MSPPSCRKTIWEDTVMAFKNFIPFLCLVTAGCDLSALNLSDEKNTESEAAYEPFLSSSYFSGRLTASLDTVSVEEKIHSDEEFFANAPETDTTEDECYNTLDHALIKSTDTYLTVGTDIDIADCMNKTTSHVTWEKARIRLYVKYECSSGGLEKYNGTAWSDLPEKPCPQIEGNKVLFGLNSEIDYRGSGTEDGKSITVKALNARQFGTDAGETCGVEFKGGVWVQSDGCIQRYLDGLDDGAANFIVKTYVGKSITHNDSDLFYRTGVIEFTFNNWKGSMAYSGADTAPKYTVENGKDSLTGIFEFGKFSQGKTAASEEVPADSYDDPKIEQEPAPEPLEPETEPEPIPLWNKNALSHSAKDAARNAAASLRKK